METTIPRRGSTSGLAFPPREALEVVELRYADGARRAEPLTPDQHVALYARCLHEGQPGLVELAAGRRTREGKLRMRRRDDPARYPRAGDQAALVALARAHRAAGEEVFCTPLTRAIARAGSAPVESGQAAWVDLDEPEAVERLRAFAHRPHLVVWSGSGGAHAYWRLAACEPGEQIEAVNRKLCRRLAGDPQSTDRGRPMRLPGSINHKAGAWCRIAWLDLASPGIPAATLTAGLEDPAPPPPPRARARRTGATYHDDAARIPPPDYFRALTGRDVPDRGGYVLCPLHEERTPSCRVWPEPERGWHCFGCGRGGTIYDLASLLDGGPSGRALRDAEFKRVKRRVQELLGR